MTNPSDIERIVMRRVYIIRVLRPLVSTGAFAAVIVFLALWGIGREVWVAQVVRNAPSDPLALSKFSLSAFAHTTLIVQALSILVIASFVYLARELARSVSSFMHVAYA